MWTSAELNLKPYLLAVCRDCVLCVLSRLLDLLTAGQSFQAALDMHGKTSHEHSVRSSLRGALLYRWEASLFMHQVENIRNCR